MSTLVTYAESFVDGYGLDEVAASCEDGELTVRALLFADVHDVLGAPDVDSREPLGGTLTDLRSNVMSGLPKRVHLEVHALAEDGTVVVSSARHLQPGRPLPRALELTTPISDRAPEPHTVVARLVRD